jgi:toxin HigB-1
MQITFSDKKLGLLANNPQKCQKEMGAIRFKLFNRRLMDLSIALTLEDVRHLPGRYHELKGDRKGQWACDLDHPYRMVFRPKQSPIPTDADGRYIWLEILGVEILGIFNYHGK